MRGQKPLALLLLLMIGIFLGVGFGSWVGEKRQDLPVEVASQMPGSVLVTPPPQPPPQSQATSQAQAEPPRVQETASLQNRPPSSPPAKPVPAPSKLTVPPESGPYVATAIPDARIVAPPPLSSGSGAQPPWLAYAVPVPPGAASGKPVIAVVIDDLGLDRRRTARVIDLAAPLTLAFLPYAQELPAQTASGRAKGHELLVHVPMEPVGANYDPGPESNLVKLGLSVEEIRNRLERDLSQFSNFVGVNNHMGSKFTADRAGMRVVLSDLQARGLLFLDSRTSAQSAGGEVAREIGIPFAERNVFLDNVPSLGAVDAQLSKLEEYARQYGHAIAIGHPHDATIDALAAWLPTLEAKGFVLVPVSAIVKRQSMLAGKKQ
ncbi:conserved exported hypothetical protein [Rhodospirillaceae bacterium LM-1]|nr:conserved exported hypothetical protein [Rhodospirillaceae bacterium LM-1]